MAELNGNGGNVPFQNKPRYNIVGVNPTLITHKMKTTKNFDGYRASTAVLSVPLADPAVSAGKANFAGLEHGGLMFLGGNTARPAIVESYYAKNCTATYKIVAMDDANIDTVAPLTELRPLPAAPFKLGPNECIQVTSTAAGAPIPEVGFVVRLDGQKIL